MAAWADPAVWDRELDVMGAKTPAADVGALMIAELVLHGWDLAAATGQDYSVSDRAAEAALRAVEANAELFRQYKGFADPVPTAAGARGPRPRAGAVRTRPGLGGCPLAAAAAGLASYSRGALVAANFTDQSTMILIRWKPIVCSRVSKAAGSIGL